MSKITILSSLITLSLVFTACSSDKKASTEDANSIIDAPIKTAVAPNKFELTSITDKKYTIKKDKDGFYLKDNKNKIILLDIFATWCPPCRAEASHLTSLQKKYPNDLVVIGITIEDGIPNEKLENFKHQSDAEYILVNSKTNATLVDAVISSLKMDKNFGIPLMVMYKDGQLIRYYQGITEEEFIESDIKIALDKK